MKQFRPWKDAEINLGKSCYSVDSCIILQSPPSSHEILWLGTIYQLGVPFTQAKVPRVRCTRTRVDINQFSSTKVNRPSIIPSWSDCSTILWCSGDIYN